MKMKTPFLLALCFTIVIASFAQDRLKPGAVYDQGQEIYAPLVGYKGVVQQMMVLVFTQVSK